MKKYWIIGLILAVLAIDGGIVLWQSKTNTKQTGSTQNSGHATAKMSVMEKQFSAYKGEQYDRIFLASMIVHHQGAVQMAKLVLTNAKHQELKTMASDIASAQTNEIAEMQSWQTAWGYATNDTATQAVVKQMQGEMDGMMAALNGKIGDDFDKAFLMQMTMHHQSAIAMSRPAASNASHQEIKSLASGIISAQTKEVNQMLQWETAWGYKTQSSSSSSMSGMDM